MFLHGSSSSCMHTRGSHIFDSTFSPRFCTCTWTLFAFVHRMYSFGETFHGAVEPDHLLATSVCPDLLRCYAHLLAHGITRPDELQMDTLTYEDHHWTGHLIFNLTFFIIIGFWKRNIGNTTMFVYSGCLFWNLILYENRVYLFMGEEEIVFHGIQNNHFIIALTEVSKR